ncbi:MAG: hypothetical protein ACLQM6_05450 [Acidobacteriaceae bacterium]
MEGTKTISKSDAGKANVVSPTLHKSVKGGALNILRLRMRINTERVGQPPTENSRADFSFPFMVITLLASIIVSSIAKSYGHGSAATGLACCTIVTIVAAKLRWESKREWWFWMALLFGIGLQIPMVLFLPWNKPYLTGTGGLALSIPGFVFTYGCIWMAEKIFSRSTSPN